MSNYMADDLLKGLLSSEERFFAEDKDGNYMVVIPLAEIFKVYKEVVKDEREKIMAGE